MKSNAPKYGDKNLLITLSPIASILTSEPTEGEEFTSQRPSLQLNDDENEYV